MSTTLNPGYYNNTSCSAGGILMPNSSQSAIELTPQCNPIDRELINVIISYLISNDIFILNQATQIQVPGQFNIKDTGQANSFLAKYFKLLNSSNNVMGQLRLGNTQINSLGNYYGVIISSEDNQVITAENIFLNGQPILPTTLPNTQLTKVVTVDGNGIVNVVNASQLVTSIPSLQQVTNVGASTTHSIIQAQAVTGDGLVTKDQMEQWIANIVVATPDVITLINLLVDQVTNNDPIIQALLDALAIYIPLAEKGVQGGVATLGLDGKLTSTQLPAISLQAICNVNNTTTTTIVAAPATTNDELATYGQVLSLLQQGVGDLNQVLSQGNESDLDIILTDNDLLTVTHNYNNSVYVQEEGGRVDQISVYSYMIDFSFSEELVSSRAWLKVSIDAPRDRLMIGNDSMEEYILTTQDFGHTPASGIAIDADKLDGYHATSFILQSDFPVDVDGQVVGNALVFDGTTWVPGTQGSGGASLLYFTEQLNGTFQTWYPTDATKDLWLKVGINRNVQLGTNLVTTSGYNNFISSFGTNPTIEGDTNVQFINGGTILGNYNFVFGSSVDMRAQTSNNIVFDVSSQIGTTTASVGNILMKSSTAGTSTYQFAGSYSLMLRNSNTTYVTQDKTSYSALLNNDTVSINNNNVTALSSYNTLFTGRYTTGLAQYNSVLTGERSFVSGLNLTQASYANVAFGTFGTVETGGTVAAVVDRDRQFFVGSGSSALSLRNAITVWKSGATQIQGALQLGTSHTNETGAPIVGMIRNNNGYLEIYRAGAWQSQVSTYIPTVATEEAAWSVIAYSSGDTPITHSVSGTADVFNSNYRIIPGILQTTSIQSLHQVSVDGDGIMTFTHTGQYNVHANIRLDITNVTLGDRIVLRFIKNGQTSDPLCNVIHTLVETTADVSVSLHLMGYFGELDTLELYIQYLDGVALHDVTPDVLGTRVDISQILGANINP